MFEVINDPVATFLKECCVFGPKEEVKKDALHKAYEQWMGDQGFSQKTKDQLCQNILQGNPSIKPLRRRKDLTDAEGKTLLAGHVLTGVSLNVAGLALASDE